MAPWVCKSAVWRSSMNGSPLSRGRQTRVRLSAEHAFKPRTDDGFGIGDDALDEFFHRRDVLDQALHHAGAPDAVVEFAALQAFKAAHAFDQGGDVGEGVAFAFQLQDFL